MACDRMGPLLPLLLLLLTLPAWAEMTLEDYEGTVEAKAGASWKPLDVGSKVASDATVRVSGQGLAEFRDGAVRIHVAKDGTYQLAVLAGRSRLAPSASLVDLVADKAGRLLGTKTGRASTVNAGVRADKRPVEEGLAWADEDEPAAGPGSEPWAAEIDALAAGGQYTEALAKVDAALAASAVPSPALTLRKAQILGQAGRAAASLRVASSVNVGTDSPYYPAALLLVSTQALLAQDYELVLLKTQEGAKTLQDPETLRSLELLQALAYRSQGRESLSQKLLSKVASEDPDSPAGKEASRLLKP